MRQTIHQPGSIPSLMGRWDARWKIAALAMAILMVAFVEQSIVAALAFALALLFVALARFPWPWFFARLGWLAVLLIFFLAWIPFLDTTEPIYHLGPLRVSQPGVIKASLLLIKACTIVSFMMVLWLTAPMGTTLKAAHALKIPGVILQILGLTYRFLHLLKEELVRTRIALRVRGYQPGMNGKSFRTLGHLAGNLLVRSYERGERVAQAMASRGFDGNFRSINNFRTRTSDILLFLVVVGLGGLLLVWDWLG